MRIFCILGIKDEQTHNSINIRALPQSWTNEKAVRFIDPQEGWKNSNAIKNHLVMIDTISFT